MVLKDVELMQIRRTGEHFKKILREIFDLMPSSAHSIAGLTRWSGINKSTCQRLVQAVTKSKDGIDVIITLPGISGLNQFDAKFKVLLNNKKYLESFQQLINEYQNLIFDYATSQSELKRLLLFSQSEGSATKVSYTKKLRKAAFETNREISGESIDLYLGIHIAKINKQNPNYLDEIVVANRVGVELMKHARPFTQTFYGDENMSLKSSPQHFNEQSGFKANITENDSFFLSDFSTKGIEKCFAGIGGFNNSYIYNHALDPIGASKFDITLAYGASQIQSNPLKKGHDIVCQSILQRSPAKQLILLSLLENPLYKASSIQAGCYPASIKALEIGHTPEDLWNEQFSEITEIKLFKPEEEKLSISSGVEHIDALLAQVFKLIGEDVSNYMGYYLDIDYPLWNTAHRFYLNFFQQ